MYIYVPFAAWEGTNLMVCLTDLQPGNITLAIWPGSRCTCNVLWGWTKCPPEPWRWFWTREVGGWKKGRTFSKLKDEKMCVIVWSSFTTPICHTQYYICTAIFVMCFFFPGFGHLKKGFITVCIGRLWGNPVTFQRCEFRQNRISNAEIPAVSVTEDWYKAVGSEFILVSWKHRKPFWNWLLNLCETMLDHLLVATICFATYFQTWSHTSWVPSFQIIFSHLFIQASRWGKFAS